MNRSGHIDTFARDNLPPPERWPEFLFELPELQFPPRLNCAVELLDRAIERGWGERECVLGDGVRWTYAEMLAQPIASPVCSLRIGPGQRHRVLLRGANSPMLAACWFGVAKPAALRWARCRCCRTRANHHRAQGAGHARVMRCQAGARAGVSAAQLPALNQVALYGDESPTGCKRAQLKPAYHRCRYRARRRLPDRFHIGLHRSTQRHDAFSS